MASGMHRHRDTMPMGRTSMNQQTAQGTAGADSASRACRVLARLAFAIMSMPNVPWPGPMSLQTVRRSVVQVLGTGLGEYRYSGWR